MNESSTLTIDGKIIPFEKERNLLEVIRQAKIDLPTFCYHSDLSVYGACRLCLVDVDSRGLMAACSTAPEKGMKVRTNTEEIREIRKINVELLLANHDNGCTTCRKSSACQLQNLAKRVGVTSIRFKSTAKPQSIDASSPSLVRDPNKCVLCGDCVRVCAEIQGVGAIDFAHRGKDSAVLPAFGKNLDKVECVYCGQCAAVCPTGALLPKSEVDDVWKMLHNPQKTVVIEIAPAVRVALGEHFGLESGDLITGQIAAACKQMGFAKVFDTSFAADLTVIEEATEFIQRFQKGEKLPQFTSCCPAWVKFAEQYFPEVLPKLSSCKSPQQMFGALAKETLPDMLKVAKKDLVVVSAMPCTAKKFEARRPEFAQDGLPEVDYVLTTQELAHMIEEAGIRFKELAPESLDMPFGFKTGAGLIFGATGGVTEAVLRYASEKITGKTLDTADFTMVRGEGARREVNVKLNGNTLKLCVVYGLAEAKKLAEEVKTGTSPFDLIEVMACPGGCVGGAGQPVARDYSARKRRTRGLYDGDKMLPLHKAQENPYIKEIYTKTLGEVGGHKAHSLLHTKYHSRRRISEDGLRVSSGTAQGKVQVSVCVGTSCYVRGAQDLLHKLSRHIEQNGLEEQVSVQASFCFERCDRGPTVTIDGQVLEKCDLAKACAVLTDVLQKRTNA